MADETLDRQLPAALAELAELALDLRWTGSQFAGRIWERLDPDAWERTKNAYMILLNAHQDRLDAAANDPTLLAELRKWLERRKHYFASPGWYGARYAGQISKVAYFSMEFGLSESLPIYSGGLGILAGDHLKSASDLGVPLVAIGLLYQQGYFRQVLSPEGWQLEAFPYNDPSSLPVTPVLGPDGHWQRVRLALPGRTLLLRVWKARVGKVTLYLLDSNDPMNNPWDRGITANLYAAGKEKRLLQEIVLGVGGWMLMEKLGIEPDVCHLNEGHAAFAVLARAQAFAEKHDVPFAVAQWATRGGNVFTTHTPVEAAFDRFDPKMLLTYARPFIQRTGLSEEQFLALGRKDPRDASEPFNMAFLALRGSSQINGVSQLHGRVSQQLFRVLFPGIPVEEVPVGAITNGVHVPTWDSPMANELWSKAYPQGRWVENLEAAAESLTAIDDVQLWDFRATARQTLVQYVRRRMARQLREHGAAEGDVRQAQEVLDPNAITLGFARRFATYKRPTLLIHDLPRLARILNDPQRPAQLLIAGKAHPDDSYGKEMVRAMAQVAARPEFRGKIVFLEDYEMVVAQNLAAGVDVWINNPIRPAEACGTSGMKMLVNGGLNLSVLDGWWDEAYSPEVGWQIGDAREGGGPDQDNREANQILDTLEYQVIPEFYRRDEQNVPRSWVQRIRASMAKLTPWFSSDRMVREYVEQAYLPAARRYQTRAADHAKSARHLAEWNDELRQRWRGVRFGEVRWHPEEGQWRFDIQAYLGDLPPEFVRLELYSVPVPGDGASSIPMQWLGAIPGAVNGHRYSAIAPNHRPAEHYTARVVPNNQEAVLPLEESLVQWQH